MDKLVNSLEAEKIEKSYETGVTGDDPLKLTSIPRTSPTGKGLGEMVRSGKQSFSIGGVQVVNGLMLSQFELQASQGKLSFFNHCDKMSCKARLLCKTPFTRHAISTACPMMLSSIAISISSTSSTRSQWDRGAPF